MMAYEKILDYWLGELTEEGTTKENRGKLWFTKSSEIDKYIKDNFEQLLIEAKSGDLDSWTKTPRGRLALVILLDQFSRNIYRDTPKAFEADSRALKLTLDAIEKGEDKKLKLIERSFLYMPLMHSEDIKMQEKSMYYSKQLMDEAPEHLKGRFGLKWANQHYNIIKKFGRFPHRNKILGRKSTKEEEEYLKKHGGF